MAGVAGLDWGLLDVGAHGDDFDAVGVPEVVAEVYFGEAEGDAEAGLVGGEACAAEEGDCCGWAGLS